MGEIIWLSISGAVAVIGAITLYFTFLKGSNDGKFKGFVAWLYDFLTFRKMVLEVILKVTYLILAIFVTLGSFALISVNFLAFLGALVLGNLALRITYEFSLVLLVICRNTSEINTKLAKAETKKEKVKEEVK